MIWKLNNCTQSSILQTPITPCDNYCDNMAPNDSNRLATRKIKFKSYKNKRVHNQLRIRRQDRNIIHDVFNLKFSQLNLGKRKLAMDFLAQKHSNGFFISLVQECHLLRNGKPSGLDSQHLILQANSGRPRATIYAHKNMPLWFNHDLSSTDVATCLWITKEADFDALDQILATFEVVGSLP